jgi:superfamily II DNA helicase RecQ
MASFSSSFNLCLSAVVQRVFPGKELDFLSREQMEGIRSFFLGNDTFVSLPTGHGKSLIFQLVVPLARKMFEMGKHDTPGCPRKLPCHPVILVVAPLNSLISDQIKSCEEKGMKASTLDKLAITYGPDGKCLYSGEFDFIFTSSETLEHNVHFLSRLEEQLIGVVVDESHCVINWYVSIYFYVNR